ncbi:MAG: hypothetical protein AABZ44_07990 [Elusimicrobiota bacterium]
MAVESQSQKQQGPGKDSTKDDVKASVDCPNCGTAQKLKYKNCKRCGWDLSAPAAWLPDWKWHLKTLGIIYAVLIVAYFLISAWLKQLKPPLEIRDIPKEATPWLNK